MDQDSPNLDSPPRGLEITSVEFEGQIGPSCLHFTLIHAMSVALYSRGRRRLGRYPTLVDGFAAPVFGAHWIPSTSYDLEWRENRFG